VKKMRKRILMATFGSLGDIHPYLAVAIGLKERGHEVTLATCEMYRSKIEREGVRFHPIRPDIASVYDHPEPMRQALKENTGTEYTLCQVLLPHLEESYEDLLRACRGKDLLVSHTLTFALPPVAEKLKLPWVSIALQPLIFLSAHDPPVLSADKRPFRLHRLSRWKFMLLFDLTKQHTRPWMKPVDELRRRLGLAPAAGHPLFEGKFSPHGSLAWFSPLIAGPRPDWPAHTRVTGFPFYDEQRSGSGLDSRLTEFLERGEPPVVFTLGSLGLIEASDYFDQSVMAAKRLGCRAILLTGAQTSGRLRTSLPDEIIVREYAPYSAVFPHAAAVVHHGGIGTTGQALRAGRPMLVVPFVDDQLDNAVRARNLGVARVVDTRSYTAKRAQAELTRLLSESSYSSRAADIGQAIRNEDGVGAACDALDALSSVSV
jgi:UDP:flavonoid glycosyltransferase YjiC (YdhE family)